MTTFNKYLVMQMIDMGRKRKELRLDQVIAVTLQMKNAGAAYDLWTTLLEKWLYNTSPEPARFTTEDALAAIEIDLAGRDEGELAAFRQRIGKCLHYLGFTSIEARRGGGDRRRRYIRTTQPHEGPLPDFITRDDDAVEGEW